MSIFSRTRIVKCRRRDFVEREALFPINGDESLRLFYSTETEKIHMQLIGSGRTYGRGVEIDQDRVLDYIETVRDVVFGEDC